MRGEKRKKTSREKMRGEHLFTGDAVAIKSAEVWLRHRGPPFQAEMITLQKYNSMFARVLLPPGEKARSLFTV